MNWRLLGVATGACILAAATAGTGPLHAQAPGRSRCGADGHVERFDGTEWRSEMQRCAQGASGDTEDDHRPTEPANGDEKCVGGSLLQYSRVIHSWQYQHSC